MGHISHASRTAPRRAVLAAAGVLVVLYGVVGFPKIDDIVPGSENVLGGASEAAADTRENCISEWIGVPIDPPVCREVSHGHDRPIIRSKPRRTPPADASDRP